MCQAEPPGRRSQGGGGWSSWRYEAAPSWTGPVRRRGPVTSASPAAASSRSATGWLHPRDRCVGPAGGPRVPRHPHPLRPPGALGPGPHPFELARRDRGGRRQLRLQHRPDEGRRRGHPAADAGQGRGHAPGHPRGRHHVGLRDLSRVPGDRAAPGHADQLRGLRRAHSRAHLRHGRRRLRTACHRGRDRSHEGGRSGIDPRWGARLLDRSGGLPPGRRREAGSLDGRHPGGDGGADRGHRRARTGLRARRRGEQLRVALRAPAPVGPTGQPVVDPHLPARGPPAALASGEAPRARVGTPPGCRRVGAGVLPTDRAGDPHGGAHLLLRDVVLLGLRRRRPRWASPPPGRPRVACEGGAGPRRQRAAAHPLERGDPGRISRQSGPGRSLRRGDRRRAGARRRLAPSASWRSPTGS